MHTPKPIKLLMLIGLCESVYGLPGDLDPSFGNGGIATSAAGSGWEVTAMAIQSDGRSVVAGQIVNGEWRVARYLPNGLPDITFSTDGWTSIRPSELGGEGKVVGVVIQPDGKIVIGGSAILANFKRGFALARFTADGSLDPTFSNDGVLLTPSTRDYEDAYMGAMTIQSDGKILAAGPTYWASMVVRYLPDGSLDTTFDSDGRLVLGTNYFTSNAITPQTDGKIVVVGRQELPSSFAAYRIMPNGSADSSFSGDGFAQWNCANGMDEAFSVSVGPDEKITVAGKAGRAVGNETFYDYAVMRLLANGEFDGSFSSDGKLIVPIGIGLSTGTDRGPWHVLRPDGKIVLVGWHASYLDKCLVRITPTGELDSTLDGGGVRILDMLNSESPGSIFGLIQQSDGKLLVSCGGEPLPVARLYGDTDTDGDGADDPTEAAKGTNPNDRDSDDDGVEDGPEIVIYGTNPLHLDSDGDGLSDGAEINTYHSNPLLADSDGDGIGDFAEVTQFHTNPKRADSDGDGLADPAEIEIHHTNPNLADTDSDGLSDGLEVNTHHCNPLTMDSDGDGFFDGYEVQTGKSPTNAGDKPALVAEARTAIEFTFPAAIGKIYRIEDSPDMTTWSTVETGIVGTGGQVQRFYSTRGQANRYFRVEEVGP